MTDKVKFKWDENKRQKNIEKRGLDIVILAPKVFADPNAEIEPDIRKDYKEDRYLIYGMADDIRIWICFTLRKEGEEDIVWLITIFKIHKKNWEKHYGKKNG
ncbi:MAG: BrnT family toxin [Treponema sp.]|nr:BrnT family toxin [Treponema sp.]